MLAEVASTLKSHLRAHDLICRWGGEEFLIMVELAEYSEKAEGKLHQLAAELVQAVRNLNWTAICPELDRVTVSAGTKIFRSGMAFQACVDAADHALLQAKRSGRNRVMTAVNPS